MDRYTVTSFDVCQPGFERLRSNSEFLLVGHVEHNTSREDLRSQFMSDIQACERPDSFDYDAARKVVTDYLASVDMVRALMYVEAPVTEDEDGEPVESDEDEESGCSAYLYIRDNAEDDAE